MRVEEEHDAMSGFRGALCLPRLLLSVNLALALLHALLAFLASFQLLRIHMRNKQLGWTRQKVFHVLIGSSNMGYFIYLALTLIAACKGWTCWSHFCGFVFMAFPKVLFFAAFLLLLSFWVDLCHQPDDDDDYEGSFSEEPLLRKASNESNLASTDSHRKCFPVRFARVGNRQKIVILVTLLVFIMVMAFAVIIWIGLGKNPIDSEVAAQVYLDLSAVGMLLLGGALACYALVLWVMRELPPAEATGIQEESSTLAFVPDSSIAIHHPQRWTTATSMQNQTSRASPI